MKKFLTLALCVAAAGTMCAQKQAVDQAAKLSGKIDQIGVARSLIEKAVLDPETANDVRTYFVAGKLEFDAYDNALKKQMINPNDKDINPVAMSEQLIYGYDNFMKALPLDSLPNAKGEVKPKYSKDIISKLNGHHNDFFNAGGTFYGEKRFYPEAYTAFMIYGNMPSMPFADKSIKQIPDSVINTAYFNAGIAAYAGDQLSEAAKAFKAARLNGTDNAQNYIYEIACWQYIASKDTTMTDAAKTQIQEVALDGFKMFGISQPLFINNLVNSLVLDNKGAQALALVTEEIGKNPESAALYGLRGFVNDRLGNDDESVADYQMAASLPDVDRETLKNASKKIFRVGTQKLNDAAGGSDAIRNSIRDNYFVKSKAIAEKAKDMNSNGADDSDLDYLIESVDYALTTYF